MQLAHRRKAGSFLVRALMCAAALAMAQAVRADPVTVINALRMDRCGRQPAAGAAVQSSEALDDVAQELSRRDRLTDAIARVGYPAVSSTSIHIAGTRDDEAIRRLLVERHCAAVNNPQFSELGVFQRGDDTWIVLAERSSPPAVGDSPPVARRALELVNAARSKARRCGRRRYDAAPPLTLSAALADAASIHARDMAQRGSMDHRGSDGSSSAERVTRVGYRWRAVAENIAAGQPDADTVVAAWLMSSGHCVNLMGPQYTEMGIAFAPAPSRNPAIYWAQVFAAPQ
jgi:uncharacterized protein YkwD